MPNINNINPSAAVAAFGPNAMQNIQMLQNPNHPFMQYMAQSVPGFASLPVPQQLQRMQIVQVRFISYSTSNNFTDTRISLVTGGFATKATAATAAATTTAATTTKPARDGWIDPWDTGYTQANAHASITK